MTDLTVHEWQLVDQARQDPYHPLHTPVMYALTGGSTTTRQGRTLPQVRQALAQAIR